MTDKVHNARNQTVEWMDIHALTEYASISQRTLREWIHRGINPLPAVRVDKKILVRRSCFDAWLESHRLQPSNSLDVDAIVSELVNSLMEPK
jgi:excisionase family DNA binding protein